MVNIGLCCSGFLSYEHFTRQFTYADFLYSNPFQILVWKHFICLYITIKLKENINHPAHFKLMKQQTSCLSKFMLGCRRSFEAYAKKVRENAPKFPLITTRCWGTCYAGSWWTFANLSLICSKVQSLQILLRARQTLHVLIFFKRKFISDDRFELHLLGRNIYSTGKSDRTLKKAYVQAWIYKSGKS